MTLGEVRKILREKIDAGLACPCCTQHVQRYSRPITSAMAAGLILLVNYENKVYNTEPIVWRSESKWTHIEDFFKNIPNLPASIRGDFSKLRFWDLIEPNPENEGYYRSTFSGQSFVKYGDNVQSNVLIFNNKSYGFRGEFVNIKHCLKNKFDYDKLMKGEL